MSFSMHIVTNDMSHNVDCRYRTWFQVNTGVATVFNEGFLRAPLNLNRKHAFNLKSNAPNNVFS